MLFSTADSLAPLPVFSQAIKTKHLIYGSGNVGMDPRTNQLVSGGVKSQTVSLLCGDADEESEKYPGTDYAIFQTRTLKNLQVTLESAGSGLGKVVNVNVYITDMRSFAEMNEACLGVFREPQPISILWQN